MTIIEDHCVDCERHMRQCDACELREVEVHYCDRCGDRADVTLDGEALCDGCVEEALRDAITECYSWVEIYRAMFPSDDLNLVRLDS